MSTGGLIRIDLLVAVVAAAAWVGAGVCAALRRAPLAAALAGVAVLVSLGRVAVVAVLAGRGWWFVVEKVTVGLPLLIIAAGIAAVAAGPTLLRAVRSGATDTVAGAVAGPKVVVPLLTAGSAAVVGVGLTFLVGYGVTWSVGLISVALVAFAALITWRSVAPGESAAGRRAGVATLAAAIVAVVGIGLAFVPVSDVDTGGGPAEDHNAAPRAVSTLRGPDPAAAPAGVAVRRFTLTAQQGTVTLSSGTRVPAWTFNGTVPGPALTAEQGDLVEVTLRNTDIAAGVTIHWHGYDVPAAEDGAAGLTQDPVHPGGEYVYRFLARQTGTYWYHTHEVSDRGVKMGLYGTLVVTPRGAAPAGLELTLPVHTFTGVAALGTNDGTETRTVAPGTPVRLRLINTDNASHRLAVAGVPARLVAIDGSDVNEPGELGDRALRLPGGGRYDVAFTMPTGPTGGVALLVDDNRDRGLRLTPEGVAPGPVAATASWPALDLLDYGRPAPAALDTSVEPNRRFTLVVDRNFVASDLPPRYAYTVNGRAFPGIPPQRVREGDLVEMTVVNRGLDIHPWHLHGHHVLVLSRDGRATTGAPLLMDTFEVRPGEVWRVAFRADNPGLWMSHCHNLSHTDRGMMLILAYDGITGPLHSAHSG